MQLNSAVNVDKFFITAKNALLFVDVLCPCAILLPELQKLCNAILSWIFG